MLAQSDANLERWPEYAAWQALLGALLGDPSDFWAAAKAWQARYNLTPDGVLGPASVRAAGKRLWLPYQLILSPHCTPALGRTVRRVVMHTTEGSSGPGARLNTAAWFQSAASRVSAHYVSDPGGIVQTVLESDVAWCAPGANRDGIHIELCGRASAAPRGETLQNAAVLVADICRRHALPVVRDADNGICGHVDISKRYGGSHWDPGPLFPWDQFLDLVKSACP